jgi:hypothetical protein
MKPDTENKWNEEDNMVQTRPATEAEIKMMEDTSQKPKNEVGNDFEKMN